MLRACKENSEYGVKVQRFKKQQLIFVVKAEIRCGQKKCKLVIWEKEEENEYL